ncbi:MAG: helix-turn-helix transcriptional regulator [Deltaproteobacteria bacterium]|nr:helix-turn-helix transcriptional regulator [Deltaproteobacteria bacterium]
MNGKLIEYMRTHKGWSREYLAERTGNIVSEATIKRVERKANYRISSVKLIAILKALGLEIKVQRQNKIQN